MNRLEALDVLGEEVQRYRGNSHAQLQRFLKVPETVQRVSGTGITYQVMVEAVWDSKKDGVLRLCFSVDDGGWRAFYPITRSFLIEPGGVFDG